MTDTPKVGEKVTLKSGGPVMTVAQVGFADSGVRCVWFVDGDKQQEGFFPAAALEAASVN